MKVSFILLCITIIIITVFIFKKFIFKSKHKFWSQQPVSRNHVTKEGIISKNPKFNVILPENMFFKELDVQNHKDISNLHTFINNHYSDTYQYSKNFLSETLNYLDSSRCCNVALYKDNDIIGFIHNKPVVLSISNKIQEFYYTDFLCMHKNYRNNNLATFLISKMISRHENNVPFIFKKETKNLPFNFINKTSYYYLLLDNKNYRNNRITHNIQFMNANNIEKIYNFICTIETKAKIHQKLSFIEFKKLYSNSCKKVLVEFDKSGNIISVLIYITIYIKNSNKLDQSIDIEHIYIDNSNYNYEIVDHLINIALNQNIIIISCLNQSYNKYFITKYDMKPSLDIYFHAYNYHINSKIDSFDMCFNFL